MRMKVYLLLNLEAINRIFADCLLLMAVNQIKKPKADTEKGKLFKLFKTLLKTALVCGL